ncbi:hypothetical protein A8L34_27880 [Bacillus sp. FJAT-27264]|uniref:hypothetical protein n=1 Tax=Paenibacillus sp. (strain DSM 101736 / FJAT-27264) TaxID=1850362 RepID=UPI0008081831|nr:hypothetical protein [Bacillus sp. FJAT-27264]OBZ15869.1 hypothetical protein A8L34_27880 [Bacillus sp. FJAT-27264]
MKITEYTLLPQKGGFEGSIYYVIRLGEGLYYKGTDGGFHRREDGVHYKSQIKMSTDIPTASHIAEKFGQSEVEYLKRNYDEYGLLRADAPVFFVGLAEAAEILGWDKRKVSTYMQRGVFPQPLQRLVSGPIWNRTKIEEYRDSQK